MIEQITENKKAIGYIAIILFIVFALVLGFFIGREETRRLIIKDGYVRYYDTVYKVEKFDTLEKPKKPVAVKAKRLPDKELE